MVWVTHVLLIIALMMAFSASCFAEQKISGGSEEMCQQPAGELKKNPPDRSLSEKIVNLALTMKPAPEDGADDLQAGRNRPAPPAQPAPPADSGTGGPPGTTGNPLLDRDPAEQQLVIKMPPPEKRHKMQNFIGGWYFKDVLRGEELTIQAFEISKNASGDLVLTPPKRAAGSYASIIHFEINEKNLKLQLRWKMKSIVGYWKTETYDLSLSEDGKTLTGSLNQKSVGGRTIEMDRVLFRQ